MTTGYALGNANMAMAWLWILLGFGSGALMGLKFHEPGWLGGYTSHKRRLYRLGHISFFGLGAINFMFALTARGCAPTATLQMASLALIVGAVLMPMACLVFAHKPRAHFVFYAPVAALLGGGLLTLIQLAHL